MQLVRETNHSPTRKYRINKFVWPEQFSAPPDPSRADRVTAVILSVFAVLAVATAIIAFMLVKNVVAGWIMPDVPGAPVDITAGEDIALPDSPQASQPMQSSNGPAAKAGMVPPGNCLINGFGFP